MIIEPRAEAEVVWRTAQVMRNVAAMLGPGWGMRVFHGDRNRALLKAHFSETRAGPTLPPNPNPNLTYPNPNLT